MLKIVIFPLCFFSRPKLWSISTRKALLDSICVEVNYSSNGTKKVVSNLAAAKKPKRSVEKETIDHILLLEKKEGGIIAALII